MIKFEINQTAGKKINHNFWSLWSKKISKNIKKNDNASVSIAVVGLPAMKKMNQIYRGKDKATNVLSFAEIDLKNTKFVQNDNGYLGEVVLCYQIVVSQAKVAKVSFESELARLLVHGVLHLLGYDHQTRAQASKMEELEDKILNS